MKVGRMDFAKLTELFRSLRTHEVDYVLVGALALSANGLVRNTEDVDLFVRPEAENVRRLRDALRAVWDDPTIDEITAEDLAGEFPAIEYVPPAGEFSLDLLARLGDAFRFEDIESHVLDWEGVPIVCATPRMLYRMKRDTVRPQDRADAAALRERFGIEED